MWRFIRRVFVLLVLFSIIFVIYRYINPVWASNFVEKIKSVPQYISNMFDGWNELIIVDETVSMTWDMNIAESYDLIKEDESQKNEEEVVDEVKEEWEDDDTRLEELNKEIEWILWKSEVTTWGDIIKNNEKAVDDNCIWEGKLTEVLWDNPVYCCEWLDEFIRPAQSFPEAVGVGWNICYNKSKWDISCEYEGTDKEWRYYANWDLLWLNDFCDWEYNTIKEKEIKSLPDEMKPWSDWTWSAVKWLSDLDYEQIKNVFGNLVD